METSTNGGALWDGKINSKVPLRTKITVILQLDNLNKLLYPKLYYNFISMVVKCISYVIEVNLVLPSTSK